MGWKYAKMLGRVNLERQTYKGFVYFLVCIISLKIFDFLLGVFLLYSGWKSTNKTKHQRKELFS